MVLMKKKLLVSISNYMKGMHVIFNGFNVSGRQIQEIEHCDVPKNIELVFD